MPLYAKILKDLLKRKDRLGEVSSIPLSGDCSAVVLNRVPKKLSDLGVFTIPCMLGSDIMSQALANLDASINLTTYLLYENLYLGELTPTLMSFSLADPSAKYLQGIIENLLVKVDKFVFSMDFMALIDVYDGRITLRVGDENVIYDVVKSMKHSGDHDGLVVHASIYFLNSFIPGFDTCLDYICGADLVGVGVDEELKEEVVDEVSYLSKIMEVSEVICEKDAEKPAPLRLNLNIQEVFKKDVIKLMDVGMIYPISDSPWIPVASENQEKTSMEVFMDDFLVYDNSFDQCLGSLEKMLKRCIEMKLMLNWEKCPFMVMEGIVSGHKISRYGIEVDRVKNDTISILPPPTSVKAIRSFLGYAGFYQRFIKDFLKLTRPMTRLLKKDVPFLFHEDCLKAFKFLKEQLMSASILVSPDWNLPFELMCDAINYAFGAVLGQRPLRFLIHKKYAKPRLIRWILLLSEFDIEIKDKKGAENVAADHFSRLEYPKIEEIREEEIGDRFPHESIDFVAAKKPRDDYATKEEVLVDVTRYVWVDSFLFKIGGDRILRRCVSMDPGTP
ncbi:uncharacterized protein LOC143635613 [Bidens hawaiensis]|uniref:uncharacterized protein LOC143635613 n=1 Tax=Bidens hawaiensis TaxID=980011 RepID=UPI0040496E4C